MIIYLFGKDTFRSRQYLQSMKQKFSQDRDPQGLNTSIVDLEKNGPDVLWQEVHAAPFLAEKRLVVVENLVSSRHDEVKQAFLDALEGSTFPSTTVLIVWESTDAFKKKVDKALSQRLAKEKFSQEFPLLEGAAFEGWVAEQIQEKGGKIERRALKYLCDNAESDMWAIDRLLDQLVAYTLEDSEKKLYRDIELADVQEFVSQKVDDNIFLIIESIVAKNPKAVFSGIEEQYRIGKDVGYVFAMLIRQYRILLEMRDLYEQHDQMPSTVMAKELGIHPYVVKKSFSLMKRYTSKQLTALYSELLDFDIRMKTSSENPKVLFDVLVARLSH